MRLWIPIGLLLLLAACSESSPAVTCGSASPGGPADVAVCDIRPGPDGRPRWGVLCPGTAFYCGTRPGEVYVGAYPDPLPTEFQTASCYDPFGPGGVPYCTFMEGVPQGEPRCVPYPPADCTPLDAYPY